MDEINKRIKDLRINEGLSMAKLAEIIGVSQGNVSDWESEKKKSTPTAKALVSIANYFNVSLDWLMTGKEKSNNHEENAIFFNLDREVVSRLTKLNDSDKEDLENYIDYLLYKKMKSELKINKDNRSNQKNDDIYKQYLPINDQIKEELIPIWGAAAAGKPVEAVIFEGYLFAPKQYKNCFAVRVMGNSMKDAGIIDNGFAIVRRQPVVENNEIALVMVDHEATIKRFKSMNDHAILVSENEDFEPMIYHKKQKKIQIAGKVVHFIPADKASIIENIN